MADMKLHVAKLTVDDKRVCREAYMASGFALEFALKGAIMKKQRLNTWPDSGPLLTHSNRYLFEQLDIDRSSVPSSLRTSFTIAMQWRRDFDYRPGRLSRKVARDTLLAATEVVEWLKNR